ncbi:SHOCT domain-containing protein [Streptomyces sp. NPDC048664]|uniref:SHOCT domain-containing protein n=1 Tax=Streptomyces sp. NPDC048664 TaxID=3154505 RepID=UPI00341656BC
MDGWPWLVASPGAILFWVVLVLVVVLLVRASRRGSPGPRDAAWASGPEQVLAERFARGEIDEEEYRRRLEVLREVRSDSAKRGP